MEPQPPLDAETRTIIDKLAEFVARNGPEFENVTKKKQLTNPKFSFLYGGEHFNYYKHRVMMEQRLMSQHPPYRQPAPPPPQCPPNMMNMMGPMPPILPNIGGPPPGNANLLIIQQLESLNTQQNTLREQIRQSEQNLQAQHTALMQQQQKTIDEMLPNTQKEYLQKSAKEEDIDLAAFDAVLQPIIDFCTKDNISAGKNWILQFATNNKRAKIVLQYLLQRSMDEVDKFTSKLHLIYLVNDVLHHCTRKNAEEVKHELENIVIPMFCSAQLISTETEALKLTKLLTLWESKGNFFDACVISKLRSPESSMKEYSTNLEATHNSAVNALKQTTKATLDNYEQQNQAFMKHANQQIANWENQKQSLEQQLAAMTTILQNPPPNMFMPPNSGNSNNLMPPQMEQTPLPPPPNLMNLMPPMDTLMPPGMQNNSNNNIHNNNNNNNMHMNNGGGGMGMGIGGPPMNNQMNSNNHNHNNQPPNRNSSSGNFFIPDLSRPPPGLFGGPGAPIDGPPGQLQSLPEPPQPPPVIEEIPATPYFTLPAGLMAPFIRLEDSSYKSLDPNDIVLPAPAPPNERLLMAVDSFYSLPSHDRPRDGDGWEKLALYEYYKVKNQAKKQKEESILKGIREKSRSPSPVVIESRVKKPPKRRYRSESRSPERSSAGKEVSAAVKASPSTPSILLDEEIPLRSRSRERSSVRSRRHSRDRRSDSPAYESSSRGGGGGGGGSDRGSRGRHRELSPPTTPVIGFKQSSNNSIDQSNKGHQMLLKMGWAGAGTGLGASGQGIDKPIDGGVVRDRQDAYKGVGMNMNDPYENFRKNKGAAFITRMKARSDDKV